MKKPSRRLGISSRKTKLIYVIFATSVFSLLLIGANTPADATQVPPSCTVNSLGTTIGVVPSGFVAGVASTFEVSIVISNENPGDNCLVTVDDNDPNERSIASLPDATGA